MPSTASVDAIFEGLPTPELPKYSVKPNYVAIEEDHQLLIANSDLVERTLGGGQNCYLGLVLLLVQCSRLKTAHTPA